MMAESIAQGTVHQAPDDLRDALLADDVVFALWQGITPLQRIRRTGEELHEGKKRACCWQGCIHRTDKAPSKWQQAVLIDKKKR
jgi:hypothetical protein